MSIKPLEADTRFLINKSLENLGWSFDGVNKNVYQEQPRTERERRKLQGKRPDYVLYSKDDEKPLIIIEAKKKGERIDEALEQGIRYAKELEAPIVFATDGLFCKSYHTKFDKTPLLNGEEVDELLREVLALKYLNNWEVNTISPKVQYSRQELIKIFDEANNMLRGDGLRAGIERFGEFANILFLKLISESEDIKKLSEIKSDFDDMCHWDYIKNLKASSRIEHINKIVYEKLNSLYKTDIFTPLSIRDTSILKEIMDKLDPLTLTDVDSDVKGDAFEYFLRESTASGNDLGEYFTPRHIVKTMVKLVNPQIGEKVYDPFCGTGGFLIESFRHIWNTMPRNELTNKMLREKTIFGNEITNTARITKMNMILAGDGHSGIKMQDSLANPINGKYDIVLANIPYSQKTKYGNLYDLPTTNGDSICVQHCMKSISSTADNGRMAIVVPEGFLFRKDLARTRELILKNCDLQSIISLPKGVFLPYTGVKTNIIYATKINQKLSSKEKRKNYWYFDVKSDGYSLDNHRRKLDSGNDLDIYQEYRKLDDEQKQEMLDIGFEIIPLEKIKENSYVLVGSRYKQRKTICSDRETSTIGKLLDKKCISISRGKNITKSSAESGSIPVIAGGQKSPYTHNQFNFSGETITISASGAYSGFIWYHDYPIWASDCSVIQVINSKTLSTKFLYYLLNHMQEDIYELQSGTGQPHVYPADLYHIKIPLPDIESQNNLVEELDSYQNIINSSKSIINNYKLNFQINNNWDLLKVKDVCEIIAGQSPSSNFYNNVGEGMPFYQGNKDFGEAYINDPSVWTTETKKEAIKNDVLISVRAPVGDVNISTETICIGRGLMALRAKGNIEYKYLFYILKMLSKDLNNQALGSTFNGITKVDLENFEIPVPDIKVQRQIIKQIELEQSLIEPSKQLIEIFTRKIQDRVNELFE